VTIDGEAGVVDPHGSTAAWWHIHKSLPQSGDPANTVRQGRGEDRGVEAVARLHDENRSELLGYVSLQHSEHRVGRPCALHRLRLTCHDHRRAGGLNQGRAHRPQKHSCEPATSVAADHDELRRF
jgi:hypothetical protein